MIINPNPQNINHAIQALGILLESEFTDILNTSSTSNSFDSPAEPPTSPGLGLPLNLNSSYCGINFDITRYIPLWVVYEKNQRISEGETQPISIFDFLQKYYNWLYCDLSGGGEYNLSYDLLDLIDIEKTKTEYYKKFLKTFVDGAPESILDTVTTTAFESFVKDIRKNVYIRKTTKEAVVYFFKTLFEINENDIKIYFPKENMLRLNGGKFDSDNFNFTYKPKKKLTDFSDVPNFSSTTQTNIVTAKNIFLGNYTLDGATFGNFETNLQISPVNSQYCISVKSSTPPTQNRHRFYSRSISGIRENLLEPAKWYKASIVVKKLSGQLNWIFFRVARAERFGAGVFFDIQNGVVGKETPYNPTFKGSIDNLQNGWYKCSITFRTDEIGTTVPTLHFFAISFSLSDGPFVTSINTDPIGTLYTHVPGSTDCDIYISNSEIVLIDQLDIGDYSTINHLGGSALNVGRLQDSDWIQDYSYLLKVGQPVENYVESYKEILHPAGLRVVYEKEMTDYEGPGEGEDSSFICEYPILKNYSAYQLGITYNTVVGSFAGVSLYGLTCCDGYSSGFTLGFTGPAYYFPNWNGSINSFNFNDINIFDFFTMCFISGFTSPNEGITCATAPCE